MFGRVRDSLVAVGESLARVGKVCHVLGMFGRG